MYQTYCGSGGCHCYSISDGRSRKSGTIKHNQTQIETQNTFSLLIAASAAWRRHQAPLQPIQAHAHADLNAQKRAHLHTSTQPRTHAHNACTITSTHPSMHARSHYRAQDLSCCRPNQLMKAPDQELQSCFQGFQDTVSALSATLILHVLSCPQGLQDASLLSPSESFLLQCHTVPAMPRWWVLSCPQGPKISSLLNLQRSLCVN